MVSTQLYHDSSFSGEIWGLFGFCVAIIFARLAVRLRMVGLRGLAGDDALAVLVIGCYTVDAVAVSNAYLNGSNGDFTEQQAQQFTDAQIAQLEHGSKLEYGSWYTYTLLIWLLKAMMLFFYSRLTFGLFQHALVKGIAVLCAVTYIAVFLTITLGCIPIHLNWQARPVPPPKCRIRLQIMYVCTILNVLTDAVLLCVPLPLLWKLRVPIVKKTIVSLLLLPGVFVITAAIVRIVKTLEDHPKTMTINRWGVRETAAGILAVNAPILKPLFTKQFWLRSGNLAATTGSTRRQSSTDGNSSGCISSKLTASLRSHFAVEMADYPEPRPSRPGAGMPPTPTPGHQHPKGGGGGEPQGDRPGQDDGIATGSPVALRIDSVENGDVERGPDVPLTTTGNGNERRTEQGGMPRRPPRTLARLGRWLRSSNVSQELSSMSQ